MSANEIKNKIATSGLMTVSLEDFYPEGERRELDIRQWLFEDLILKEKEFRTHLKNHDWAIYQNCFVAVYCSTDAIIPQWAYMLIGDALEAYSRKTVYGPPDLLETLLMEEALRKVDLEKFVGQRVILKGCGHLPIPPHAYLLFAELVKPVARSLMFGEACSTVPIFKRQNK